uniref:NADH dehydrogenase subunit 6 n=1 Tax=Sternaspis buzhinskajae TaxID=2931363 RepID=A0A9E8G9R9_9ANNE|nr:NADH dehydrogenase subunit 6 [Sternaspis buzhinskajae]
MTLLLLLSLIFSFIVTLPLSTSPLILGMTIWFMALLTALLTALLHLSWFGFIIFLIYIGGMLVMFAYFSAIAPDQQMKIYFSQLISFFLIPPIVTMFIIKSFSAPLLTSIPTSLLFSPQTKLFIMLWAAPFFLLTLILFFTLIAVTKIVFQARAPLRPFNTYV